MHDTIDTFFNIVRKRNIKIKFLTEEETNDIIEEIINEKLGLNKNFIFSSAPKYKVLAARLKRVVKKSMKYIRKIYRNVSKNGQRGKIDV